MIKKEIIRDLYINKRMSSDSIAKKLGMKHGKTVRRWLEKHNIPRRTISESITKYPKTSFGKDLKLKAYMLGLRAGDVHARRIHKVIRVQTTTTHPAQVEMMNKTFGNFSNVGKHTFFNKNFNIKQWFVYCDLNESFSFMLQKPEEIPEWIMHDNRCFYNFIAGYSDSEGSWKILKSHDNSVRFVFQLGSQDKKILNQIIKKFRQLRYAPNIYLDTKVGVSRQGKNVNADIYRIMMYRTKNVLELAKILLPLSRHQEKIDKINLILRSEGRNWSDIKDEISKLRNDIKDSRLQNQTIYNT
ncbi:MAG: hypothetical protein ABIA21_01685 [Candidatus Aenigmatarchaeota archaeon]